MGRRLVHGNVTGFIQVNLAAHDVGAWQVSDRNEHALDGQGGLRVVNGGTQNEAFHLGVALDAERYLATL